mmetsp:Transcript_75552/g.179499  ORF Transcript_75552/g.179499 Transcript_75552/m.179499 type:complete len:268 (+) Transcript_75552:117-920(+)
MGSPSLSSAAACQLQRQKEGGGAADVRIPKALTTPTSRPMFSQEMRVSVENAQVEAVPPLNSIVRSFGVPRTDAAEPVPTDAETSEGSSHERAAAEGSTPAAGRRQRHSKLQIATSLRELQDEDPDCVLVVRRIGKLGFNSLEYVHEHFEQFGRVMKVLGSNRHERDPSDEASVRLRPSGIAFVLMERAADAAQALSHGTEHLIHNHPAQVRQFQQRSSSPAEAAGSRSSPVNAAIRDQDTFEIDIMSMPSSSASSSSNLVVWKHSL